MTLLDHVSVPEEQIHPLRSTDAELPDEFDLQLWGSGATVTAPRSTRDPPLDATEPIA